MRKFTGAAVDAIAFARAGQIGVSFDGLNGALIDSTGGEPDVAEGEDDDISGEDAVFLQQLLEMISFEEVNAGLFARPAFKVPCCGGARTFPAEGGARALFPGLKNDPADEGGTPWPCSDGEPRSGLIVPNAGAAVVAFFPDAFFAKGDAGEGFTEGFPLKGGEWWEGGFMGPWPLEGGEEPNKECDHSWKDSSRNEDFRSCSERGLEDGAANSGFLHIAPIGFSADHLEAGAIGVADDDALEVVSGGHVRELTASEALRVVPGGVGGDAAGEAEDEKQEARRDAETQSFHGFCRSSNVRVIFSMHHVQPQKTVDADQDRRTQGSSNLPSQNWVMINGSTKINPKVVMIGGTSGKYFMNFSSSQIRFCGAIRRGRGLRWFADR